MAVTNRIVRPAEVADRPGKQGGPVGEPVQAPRRTRTSSLAAVRVLGDALVIGAAVAAAFPLRFRWHLLEATPAPLDLPAHLVVSVVWLAAVVGSMASHHLYDEDTLGPGGRQITRIRRALLEAMALVSAVVFLLRFLTLSRGWFVLVVLLSLAFLVAERRALRSILGHVRASGRLRRPAILVGSEPSPSASDSGFDEFEVVATVPPEDVARALRAPAGAVATVQGPDPVVIVDTEMSQDDLWRLVIQAGDAGYPVFLRSPFRSLPADRVTTRTLGERTIMKVSPPALTGLRAFEKRLLDLLVALALLAVMALPMVVIALAILISSGRPLFYRQQRVGKNGVVFSMWKFRTMRVDAEAETGPVWASTGDDRRTSLGRVLRRLSLDELPQLWNVLRGQMSIVGPRPERPVFVARFSDDDPWYRFRHRIRPGITGLAQVRGLRGDTPLGPRVESDNWYIEHWSLWLDLRIAASTVLEMMRGRNAR